MTVMKGIFLGFFFVTLNFNSEKPVSWHKKPYHNPNSPFDFSIFFPLESTTYRGHTNIEK